MIFHEVVPYLIEIKNINSKTKDVTSIMGCYSKDCFGDLMYVVGVPYLNFLGLPAPIKESYDANELTTQSFRKTRFLRATALNARTKFEPTETIKMLVDPHLPISDFFYGFILEDPETGKIDIDRISTEIPTSKAAKMRVVKDILKELEKTLDPIPLSDIMKQCTEKGMGSDDVEKVLAQLREAGDIFEPKHLMFRLTH